MASNGWLSGGGGGKAVDVHELLTDRRVHGLASIVAAGALLSLGTTSDGGALGITVTIDGEWRREYVRSSDELDAYLAEAVPAVEDLTSGPRPSAEGRPRRRARSSRT